MIIPINDINDSRIDQFRSLKDSALKNDNKLIAESEKVFIKLIDSKIKIHTVLCSEKYLNKFPIQKYCDQIYLCAEKLLREIIGFKIHHGIIAICDRPKYVPILNCEDRVVVLNGLTSPENVGAIIRNCAAFNINSIIIDHKTCSPYLRRCVRVSTGNIFKMKVSMTYSLKKDLEILQDQNYAILSTANISTAENIINFSFPQKSCLIVGSEGHGIDSEILKISNHVLKIPINDQVAHLNAACSNAIFLYQSSI